MRIKGRLINVFFNIVDRFYPLAIMVFLRGFGTALRTGVMKRKTT